MHRRLAPGHVDLPVVCIDHLRHDAQPESSTVCRTPIPVLEDLLAAGWDDVDVYINTRDVDTPKTMLGNEGSLAVAS